MMEIEIADLQFVINRLLEHLVKTRGVTKVEIKNNFYWNIPDESVYDMDTQPKTLDVGDLCADWEFIAEYLDKENQPVAYQLTEVAPLLRYIGQILGKELAKYGG